MSMIDVILLRTMKTREEYNRLGGLVRQDGLSEQTWALFQDFKRYYETFPSHEKIDPETFVTRFPGWHPGITDERTAAFIGILRNIFAKDADEDQRRAILQDLADLQYQRDMRLLLEEASEGDVSDLLGRSATLLDGYKRNRGVREVRHIDTPIGDLLQDEFDDTGVSWRLHCLRNSMRRLRGGDFGIIAGRPDKGKTSFIASEATFVAPQLPEDKNVVWLNNEGPGRRIIPRFYQAALNLTMDEMKVLHSQGKLVPMYQELMGRDDKIRVIDVHGLNNTQVAMLLEQHNPGLVVFDMLDKIGGFEGAARTDLMLEMKYDWGRDLCVKHDMIGWATSQISVDGDGERFPTMDKLKDSKTGKQGACDFQIMIGNVHNKELEAMRYIGVVKNKLRKPSGKSDPQAEVIFDAVRCRYRDGDIETV